MPRNLLISLGIDLRVKIAHQAYWPKSEQKFRVSTRGVFVEKCAVGYVEIVRTHLRKHVLSRSAPTQPTNDRTKMKIASVMTRIVRSKTTSNTSEYLDRSESCTSLTPLASLRRFFSENAQHPAPTNANAANSTTQHTTLGNTQHQNYNRTDCGCSKVRFCPYISPN